MLTHSTCTPTAATADRVRSRPREGFRRLLPTLIVIVLPSLGVWAVLAGSKADLYAVYAGVAALSLAAERFIPFVEVPPGSRWKRRTTDFVYFLTSPLMFLAVQSFGVPVMHWIRDRLIGEHGVWPVGLPLWVQVLIGLIGIEFAYYWIHRANHGDNILWRSHRIHHTPPVLDLLMNWRLHWLDGVTHHIIARFGPLVLLGAPPQVVSIIMVMNITRSVFPHLNADVRSGRLFNYVFSTPEVHRWHHLRDPKLAQVNFGDTTNIWDHIFGTYSRPGVTPQTALGISGDQIVPEGWVKQLLAPWSLPGRAYRAPA